MEKFILEYSKHLLQRPSLTVKQTSHSPVAL